MSVYFIIYLIGIPLFVFVMSAISMEDEYIMWGYLIWPIVAPLFIVAIIIIGAATLGKKLNKKITK